MKPRARVIVVGLAASVAAASLHAARAQYDCSGVSETTSTSLSGVQVVSGLSLPLFVTAPPGDRDRIFIVEKAGRIKIHKHGQPAGTTTTFLDISAKVYSASGEPGLLGLAFDPDYATTRRFWVDYVESVAGQFYIVIARYTASAGNPDVADTTELRLFRILKLDNNHNGGMLAFAPDGFLYISVGDGGGVNDGGHGPCGNGQNRSVLLAKVLRIDVRGIDPSATAPDCGLEGANYTIPSTNPFRDGVGIGNCDEVWDYGFRNPWRLSFDAANGDLYIGDVGEKCTEEVDFEPHTGAGGVNYGWRQMEGSHCFDLNNNTNCDPAGVLCGTSPPCHDPSIVLPVVEYGHSGGACAVTGGYVYRGCRMPAFRGRYFYADYCTGKVSSFVMAGGLPTLPLDISAQYDPTGTVTSLSSFGLDGQGEIYAVSLNGFVRKIVPQFTDLEVSGGGAGASFVMSKTGSWTWEDVFVSTDIPVSFYRVYRGSVGGAYNCIAKPAAAAWPGGGDAVVPVVNQLFTYVVTAVNASGQETKPGTTGTFNSTTCP